VTLYTFNPPTVDYRPAVLPETHGVQRRLFRYFGGNPKGMSVVTVAGHFVTVDTPTMDQLVGTEGVNWFLGGHVYVVTQAVADALAADGYGTSAAPPEPSWSTYGGLFWGEIVGYTWGQL
jgi:hypothetical protein